MIKGFSCHNFRNIQAEQLEFEKINILIGPNNSGKSNFIKAMTFFSEMLKNENEGNLKSAFLNAVSRNGWGHILNKQVAPGEPISFSWEIDLNGKPVRYRFEFTVGDSIGNCNIILEELNAAARTTAYKNDFNYFRCHDTKIGTGNFSTAIKKGYTNKRLAFKVDSKETIIMQFKDILLNNKQIYGNELIRVNIAQMLYDLQKYFEGFSVYTSAQFNTKLMRQPVNIKNIDDVLNYDASNCTNVFNRYASEDMLWKDLFEERMRELIPNLKRIDVATAYYKLIFRLLYNNEQYDLSDISEGTLKGLILNM